MSNAGMDHLHLNDQRLTELEIKSSYCEDLLDTLNQTVFRQQQQIDMLIEVVRALRLQGAEAATQAQSPQDLPPHY